MKKEKWILAVITVVMVLGSMTGLCILMERIQGETVVESVKKEQEADKEEAAEQEGIAQKPFQVLVSGMDTSGSKNRGRNDLNLLLTVNPNSKTILITNIPRDLYVKVEGLSEAEFKGMTKKAIRLTKESFQAHPFTRLCWLGSFGSKTLVKKTVEGLLDTKVDYFVQINFPGFSSLIDAIGGVDVNVEEDFRSDWGNSYKKGNNHLDGKAALAFVRERHHLNEQEFRDRNQVKMMQAIISKLAEKSVLEMDADALYKLWKDNVKTDMGAGEILSLIRMQVGDRAKWNIKSAMLKGDADLKELGGYYESSTENPRFYVLVAREASLEKVKKKIRDVGQSPND